MKIGASAFAWTTKLERKHISLFPSIREHGIEGLEVPMFDPSGIDTKSFRQAFEANDLECTVCAILPSRINPIGADAGDREKALAHLVKCVETAAELGAYKMGGPLYSPIGYLPGRRRTQDEWNWAVECFQSLGDVLDRNEMELAIEPVNRSETFFLNTAAEANALCDAVGHSRVGVLIDTFHANIEEKSIAVAMRSAGKRLKHVHASENDRGLLGSGHVDFPGIVATLKEIDYDGYLTIEGFGYSADEKYSLGALWGDMEVTPSDLVFEGATYLRELLEFGTQTIS